MATPSVYQRVGNAAVTPSDYDSSVGKVYLRFNGVNQWLQTNSIDFSYTDKMQVFAGVRKLSDASTSILLETSQTADGNNGSFNLAMMATGAVQPQTGLIGARVFTPYDIGAAPKTSVVSVVFNNSLTGATQISLRENSSIKTGAAVVDGTGAIGNYGNYPLYIGARAGTSLFFNGNLYQLIIAGGSVINIAEEDLDLVLNEAGDSITAETTVPIGISTIEACERFVNRKTLAY